MVTWAKRARRLVRSGLGRLAPARRAEVQSRVDRWRLTRRRRPARWGTLRSLEPISDHWGLDRGTPVDRYFFDGFLQAQAALIRGRVLEIRDDACAREYGGDRVASTLVVDVEPTNERADLVADLCEPGSLGDERVDAVILTQTIGVLRDYPVALENLWGALRPGGAMLITNNVVGRVTVESDGPDLVRHTPLGLRMTVERVLPHAHVEAFGFGNLVTSMALLHGIAAEELTPDELAHEDDLFPTSCAVVVRRPVAAPRPICTPEPSDVML